MKPRKKPAESSGAELVEKPSIRIRVSENYLGVQLYPSDYVRAGHIALSPESRRYLQLHIGEQVFVRKLDVRYSEGMIVDEITLEGVEKFFQQPSRGVRSGKSFFLPFETLMAEGGYALVNRVRFGAGRRSFKPLEKVIIYSERSQPNIAF